MSMFSKFPPSTPTSPFPKTQIPTTSTLSLVREIRTASNVSTASTTATNSSNTSTRSSLTSSPSIKGRDFMGNSSDCDEGICWFFNSLECNDPALKILSAQIEEKQESTNITAISVNKAKLLKLILTENIDIKKVFNLPSETINDIANIELTDSQKKNRLIVITQKETLIGNIKRKNSLVDLVFNLPDAVIDLLLEIKVEKGLFDNLHVFRKPEALQSILLSGLNIFYYFHLPYEWADFLAKIDLTQAKNLRNFNRIALPFIISRIKDNCIIPEDLFSLPDIDIRFDEEVPGDEGNVIKFKQYFSDYMLSAYSSLREANIDINFIFLIPKELRGYFQEINLKSQKNIKILRIITQDFILKAIQKEKIDIKIFFDLPGFTLVYMETVYCKAFIDEKILTLNQSIALKKQEINNITSDLFCDLIKFRLISLEEVLGHIEMFRNDPQLLQLEKFYFKRHLTIDQAYKLFISNRFKSLNYPVITSMVEKNYQAKYAFCFKTIEIIFKNIKYQHNMKEKWDNRANYYINKLFAQSEKEFLASAKKYTLHYYTLLVDEYNKMLAAQRHMDLTLDLPKY